MSTLKVDAIVDKSSGNTATINGQTPSSSNMMGHNLIINGAMQVAQRGTSSTSTANISYHTVDRFNFRGQSTGVFTIAQDTDSPADFTHSTKITVTTPDASIGSGERYWVTSYLEGNTVSSLNFGSSNAKTVTLSFYVKSSLTGTFSGGLVNSAFDRAYAFTYTISSANTWERKTVTIPGDTSGTWLTTTGIGISVSFDLGAATNRQQSAGAWTASGSVAATGASQVIATNGATWQITGVQLEVGSQATPFEHRSFGDELAKCQRYYQRTQGSASGYQNLVVLVNYSTGTDQRGVIPFTTEMREGPAVSTSGNLMILGAGGNLSSINAGDGLTTHMAGIRVNTTSNMSTGQATLLRGNNDGTAHLQFDAEL